MKYSYEYKKKCVELYREGKWAETPDGVSQKRFHDNIREWVRLEEAKYLLNLLVDDILSR